MKLSKILVFVILGTLIVLLLISINMYSSSNTNSQAGILTPFINLFKCPTDLKNTQSVLTKCSTDLKNTQTVLTKCQTDKNKIYTNNFTLSGTLNGYNVILNNNNEKYSMLINRQCDNDMPVDDRKNGSYQNMKINETYYLAENGYLYIYITNDKNIKNPVKRCIDYSNGYSPLPQAHSFTFNNSLKQLGLVASDIYVDPNTDKIFASVLGTTKDTFLNTSFYNIMGNVDKLYNYDGTLNTNFLGISSVRVQDITPIKVPFDISGMIPETPELVPPIIPPTAPKGAQSVLPISPPLSTPYRPNINKNMFTYNNVKNNFNVLIGEGGSVDKNVVSIGYSNIDNTSKIDPVRGITFPVPGSLSTINPENYATAMLMPVKKDGQNGSGGTEGSAAPFHGYAPCPKTYPTCPNYCGNQVINIKQPYTINGSACPDSQDVCLSKYVYDPATSCSWVRVGDAWCSYQRIGDDNMIISDWGKLYHGTTEGVQNPFYNKSIMFVFEGTEETIDWLYDAFAIPMPSSIYGCLIHAGFWLKFHKWVPLICNYLKMPNENTTPYKKIIFGGHSLGGAIAQLAAGYFKNRFGSSVEIEIFSQGAPCPFYLYTPAFVRDITYNRYVGYFWDQCWANPNRKDPVPDFLTLCGYVHWVAEKPVRRVKYAKWEVTTDSFGDFVSGISGCSPNGGRYDASNVDVIPVLGQVLGVMEHSIDEYFNKISNIYCPGGIPYN